MNSVLHYKGYSARPEYSADDQIFYGKSLGIDDLVDFYTEDARKIELEFHAAVDDYLAFCKEIGKDPQKTFSGTFNVRVVPELHRKAALKAQEDCTTLNRVVEEALKEYLEPRETKTSIMVVPPEMVKQFTQPVPIVKAAGTEGTFYGDSTKQWSDFLNKKGSVKVC